MTINDDFKSWCADSYDKTHEDYYIKNAYYIADRERVSFEKRQGILAILIGILYLGSRQTGQVHASIIEMCYWFCAAASIVLIASYLCGIVRYDANDYSFATATYIISVSSGAIMLAMIMGLQKQSIFFMISISLMTILRMITVLIVHPMQFYKMNKDFRKETIRFAEFKKKAYENAYKQKANQANNTEYDDEQKNHEKRVENQNAHFYESEEMQRALHLFDNCDHSDKNALKRRYRLLAKQYHPDHGGDTNFFQCVVAVYEMLSDKIPNEKE